MASQIHRRFTDDQVMLILELYNKKAISLQQILQQLECSRGRFYQILKAYRHAPEEFTIAYARNYPQHRLPEEVERVIREELEIDRELIGDKETPLWQYNYAAVRDEVVRRLGHRISAQTVRNRAREWGFYIPKVRKEKSPPREVVTEAAGMLLQHDASYHKWSPHTDEKWTLITTLEDYSRYLLYADFVETETAWAHIKALESVILKYGVGLAYYVYSHSIFINMEIAMLTPPVGMNLYVLAGATKDRFEEIVFACIPFIVCLLISMILVMIFPQIATWLPSRIR